MSPSARSTVRQRPLVQRERESLSDDFLSFGPDAPTVLEDWTATQLLEHLLMREHRPLAGVAAGSGVPVVSGRGQRALQNLRALTWVQQVELFRRGHGRLSPLRAADRPMNTLEYLVHHEDLLRARPGWQPRELGEVADEEVWSQLTLMARVLVRAAVDVILLSELGGIRVSARGGDPEGSVRVRGTPTELLLWAFGRDRVAQATVEGDAQALLILRAGSRGF